MTAFDEWAHLVRIVADRAQWCRRAESAENALRAIAELPEPLPNKNSALNQCAYLKDVAQSALYIAAALSSEDATRPTGDKE